MIVVAVDPGPTWSAWARLEVTALPGVRCTYLASGMSPSVFAAWPSLLAGVDAVIVEAPAGYAFTPARVPHLLDTSRVAGGLLWLAESHGLRVVQCTAQQVRKALAGKANAGDDVVRQIVRRNVFGCPATPSDHVADAIAVGVLGAWMLAGVVSAKNPNGVNHGEPAAPQPRARRARRDDPRPKPGV